MYQIVAYESRCVLVEIRDSHRYRYCMTFFIVLFTLNYFAAKMCCANKLGPACLFTDS